MPRFLASSINGHLAASCLHHSLHQALDLSKSLLPNVLLEYEAQSKKFEMMQVQRRTKGPLLPAKAINGRPYSKKAFVKNETTFEVSKMDGKSTSKGNYISISLSEMTCSEYTIVKQFDSSKIDSVLLYPKILARKVAMAKNAAD